MSCQVIISVVIVSYNTRQITLECLRAVHNNMQDMPFEVWVVDNASTDGSPAAIQMAFPEVHLIKNKQNIGYGTANNQAMKQARGEFFLLLNSDAFLKQGTVNSLINYLRQQPEVAVVAPRIVNPDGSLQLSCFRFQSPLRAWLENLWISSIFPDHTVLGNYRRWAHDSDRIVDYVIGACMLVRRKAYEQVGKFDEGFFMYAEESDWQRRMRDKGWKVAFTSSGQVVHLAGASGEAEKSPKRNGYFYESLDYYYLKHYGILGLVSFRLAMMVGCFLRMILWGIVIVCVPKRREMAVSKARLYSWLVVRQSTYWKLDNKRIAGAA